MTLLLQRVRTESLRLSCMLSQRIARLFRTGGRKKTKQFFGVVGTAVADSNHSNEMQPWGRACSIQHAGSWPHMKAAGCMLSLLRVSAMWCIISAVHHFSFPRLHTKQLTRQVGADLGFGYFRGLSLAVRWRL